MNEKKTLISLLSFVITILMAACSVSAPFYSSDNVHDTSSQSEELSQSPAPILSNDIIDPFSYTNALNKYIAGDPGVKTEGFNNIAKGSVTNKDDAIDLAKNEITIEYNATNVYFDASHEMWLVHFFTLDMLGGDQSVYIDSNGLTTLIVYGE